MLRLSKLVLAGVAAAAVLVSNPAFAQAGLGSRLDAQESQLAQAEQTCGEVNLAEYARLLEEASQNKQRAEKAKKKNVPVDEAQVNADLAKAMTLFARAQMAHARQCIMQAQRAQPQANQTSMNLSPFARDVLAAHNAARAAVGAQPLNWDPVLEGHAAARAGELAQARQLVHASREGRGTERENILQAPLGYSPGQMMARWTKERSHLVPGLFPNVSDTGNWMDVAHYTQMIWPTTTDIGCGYAPGGGFNWVVCRYNPGGNKDGKPAIADANSSIRPRLIGGDYGQASADPVPQRQPKHSGAWYVGGDFGAMILEDVAFDYGLQPTIPPSQGPMDSDDEFWAASGGLIANLSEDTRLELGVGLDQGSVGDSGVYWDPVSQVTVGPLPSYFELEAVFDYVDTKVEPPDLTGKPEVHSNANQSATAIGYYPIPDHHDYIEDNAYGNGATTLPAAGGGQSAALSFMINGMLDFGDDDGISGFVGGGVGVARVDYNNVRAFSNQSAVIDDSDTQFAWQMIRISCSPGDTYCETNVLAPEMLWVAPPPPPPVTLEIM